MGQRYDWLNAMDCHCSSSCCDGYYELLHPGAVSLPATGEQRRSSVQVETPAELQSAYQGMLAYAQPKRRPTLMCRDHVAQVGRWFAQGVLVIGLIDIRKRVQSLSEKLTLLQQHGGWLRPIPEFEALNRFAQIQVVAHEFGHELNRHDQRVSPFDSDPEAAADYWAGWLEAQRRDGDEESGAAFFATLGCNVQGCDHPTSAKRSEAYRNGFAAGRTVFEQAQQHSATNQDGAHADLLPPKSKGWSFRKIAWGVAAAVTTIAVTALAGSARGGSTYDPRADRYRDKRGQFTRG